MLNRRSLRAKVLQTVYAYHVSDNKDVKVFEKQLLKNVEEVSEMYIWMLNLIDTIAAHVLEDVENRSKKFLPSEKDKMMTTKLDTNTFIESLRLNEEYIHLVRKYKVDWSFDPEVIRSIFLKLVDSDEYMEYLHAEDRSIAEEKNIIRYLFRSIILKSAEVEQVFDAKFINWYVDDEVMKALVTKTFKNFSFENPAENKLADLTPNWVEDKMFILELFSHTIRHGEEYEAMIAEKTKNWDVERIALMDILIMRMALVEFEYFSTIPVKVTMNEYIELAKSYSSKRSSNFINGVLDKILSEMKSNGRVNKHGRGLIN